MKQKQRILEGPTGSNLKELSEAETNSQSMRKKNQGGWFVLEDLLLILTLMILELIFSNSKENSILRSFLTGLVQLRESLNTRTFLKIRRLS